MEDQNDLEQPKKAKKPRTAAQIETLKLAQQIRKQNAIIKKEKIAEIKQQYRGKQKDEPKLEPAAEPVIKSPVKQQPAPKKVVYKAHEEDEEEEVIIVKKKPKKKIIYESESEDDNPPPQPKFKKEKSQQQPQLQQQQQFHQPVQRFYPMNQRHTPYGVFAII